ncbi:unnamed protein product, partial [marine sediment metagenome]
NRNINELNQGIDSTNKRIDGVYAIVSKSDKGIVEMKTGIEAGFPSIENILNDIETGIISLQPIPTPIPDEPDKLIPIPTPIPDEPLLIRVTAFW